MIEACIWAVTLGISVPAAMLAIECALGLLPRRNGRDMTAAPPPFIVLMPAHDEALGIAQVVAAVMAQLRACDALVVVADNCTDGTAAIARGLGAVVVERTDPAERGKGHALEFGRDYLASAPSLQGPRVVIVLDADCVPESGALAALASLSQARRAVVQGAYLMEPPPGADAMVRVSCFAFLVKNLVRQSGLQRLAGMTLLQGSGMAFPRATFERMHWTSSLVEDLDMGLDLLLAGRRVVFAETARFTSAASSRQATAGQRRRWEHGMMQAACRYAPRLLAAALRRGRGGLALVALDLLVPPTVLLLLLLVLATILVAAAGGFGLPLQVLLGVEACLGSALLAAWWYHARAMLPLASLLRIPGYVIWKMPLLAQFVTRRERVWLRTERDP